MALRRPAGTGLLLVCCRSDGRSARPEARRANRPRSLPAHGGRHLAPRLEPARPGLVRVGRGSGQAVALGDSARNARAQMVGSAGKLRTLRHRVVASDLDPLISPETQKLRLADSGPRDPSMIVPVIKQGLPAS